MEYQNFVSVAAMDLGRQRQYLLEQSPHTAVH